VSLWMDIIFHETGSFYTSSPLQGRVGLNFSVLNHLHSLCTMYKALFLALCKLMQR